jgi:hypothetical protein
LISALALLRECTQASTVVGASVTEQIAEQVNPAIPWLPSVATIETPVVNKAIASRNSLLATPGDRASHAGASSRSKPYELVLVSPAAIIAHLGRNSLGLGCHAASARRGSSGQFREDSPDGAVVL